MGYSINSLWLYRFEISLLSLLLQRNPLELDFKGKRKKERAEALSF